MTEVNFEELVNRSDRDIVVTVMEAKTGKTCIYTKNAKPQVFLNSKENTDCHVDYSDFVNVSVYRREQSIMCDIPDDKFSDTIVRNNWYKITFCKYFDKKYFNDVFLRALSDIPSLFPDIKSFEYRDINDIDRISVDVIDENEFNELKKYSPQIYGADTSFIMRPFIEPLYFLHKDIPVYNEFHIEFDYRTNKIVDIKMPYEKDWLDVNISKFGHKPSVQLMYDAMHKELTYAFETNLLKCENELLPFIKSLALEGTVVFRFILYRDVFVLMDAEPLSELSELHFLNATRTE